MKYSTLLLSALATVSIGLASAAGLSGCRTWGVWATAEDQGGWPPPCPAKLRGPQYDVACIDDPTDEEAIDACPCNPGTVVVTTSTHALQPRKARRSKASR